MNLYGNTYDPEPKWFERLVNFGIDHFGGFVVLYITFLLTSVIAVGYVLFHFIAKYW